MSSNDLAEYAAGLAGDLPQETRDALRALKDKATPEVVRRVLPRGCTHPNVQLVRVCPDCGWTIRRDGW